MAWEVHVQPAVDLIRHIQSARSRLPPFQTEKFRLAGQELNLLRRQDKEDRALAQELVQSSNDALEASQNDALAEELARRMQLREMCMNRIERCMLAYIMHRKQLIQQARFIYGTSLPETIEENMSEQEKEFLASYNSLLASHSARLGGLEFFNSLEVPRTGTVKVICVRDFGDIEVEDNEFVHLTKNCKYNLPHHVARPLIMQGYLQITPEEQME